MRPRYIKLEGVVFFSDLPEDKECKILDEFIETIEAYKGQAGLSYKVLTEKELEDLEK